MTSSTVPGVSLVRPKVADEANLGVDPLPHVEHMRIGVVCRLLANLALCVWHFFSAASVLLNSAAWAPL